ncbi:EAL-associated domain-containing protein [Herbaspirillum sp. VT-16-41]|uniref:EAL-associated domain-containing protein n=1 Tax=Herbaspirillum sp. VT-16-41 TaxID=1953765 RepID=UPI001C2C380A
MISVCFREGRQKNWSWRPYFFESIVRMNVEKKGILSNLYTDIDRNEQIRTYSYPISKNKYIFMDIPYDYLFEQEGLL